MIAVRPRLPRELLRPAGRGVIGIVEHRGDTKETAIRLVPHHPTDLPFPSDQSLGLEDRCWLMLDAVTTLSPKPRAEDIELEAVNGGLGIDVLDDEAEEASASREVPAGARTLVPFEVTGGERRYLKVKREALSVGHKATYQTPVSYLRLDRALGIHVDDETGVDWGGADEPNFQLFVDDVKLLSTEWDDADTGEEWPKLQAEVKRAAEAVLGSTRAVPYAEAISGTVDETDGILTPARGESWFFIDPLPANQIEQKYRSLMKVKDAIKDGQYTFFCLVSRDP